MKKTVVVDGKKREIEFGGDGRFRIDSLAGEAEIVAVGGGKYSVVIGGAQHTVHIERGGNGCYRADTREGSFEIEIIDPRRLVRGGAGLAVAGAQTVTAPMPGKVVEIKVACGDSVRVGDGVIVIEAMKMQNELKAAKDGVVTAVNVSAGDAVVPGGALVVID